MINVTHAQFYYIYCSFNESVLALDTVSLFVGILTPLTSLDEDCLVDAIDVARSSPLRLPTEFSDEDIDASRPPILVDLSTDNCCH